jgi:hypothetical protein
MNGERSYEDAMRVNRLMAQMALSIIEDEGNQSAELAQTVCSLGFSYRIVRLQNRFSKSKPIQRPIVLKSHGTLVQNGAANQSTFHQYFLKVLGGFNRLLIAVGVHSPNATKDASNSQPASSSVNK